MEYSSIIEEYLEKPYWVIDILPKQVPAKGEGQYFNIEKYYLKQPHRDFIYQKFLRFLVKLNCYHDFKVSQLFNDSLFNPHPDTLVEIMSSGETLYIVIESENTMIGIDGEDHYMTLYNPNEEFLQFINTLAQSEGLFVWKPI